MADPKDRRFIQIVPREPLPRRRPESAPVEGTEPRMDEIDVGPLTPLLGVWRAAGTGWNMIALPFADAPPPPDGFKFRVLMNQYDEELSFTFVDDDVPNRGLLRSGATHADQQVATVDYQQVISQVAVEDRPPSTVTGGPGDGIHHEPGLWLFMRDLRSGDTEGEIDIARMASIPHGNSVLALGHSRVQDGLADIPKISGFPIGRFEDLATPGYDLHDDPYLAPYLHYVDNPFMGNVNVPGFPGFHPVDMNAILRFANQGLNVKRTTTLTVDTTRRAAGIANAPFAKREADPVSMKSTFWIQELHDTHPSGEPKFRLQYSQVVMLEFFRPREDEFPGRALWPHISIATLEKVPAEYEAYRDEPTRKA